MASNRANYGGGHGSVTQFMSIIWRSFRVSYELQVQFTQNIFEPTNLVLKTVLYKGGNGHPHKTIVILDEALARTQPDISSRIENYFETHSEQLQLVCPPIVIEGGERTKNSYFHVSEIQSHLDRYHIDRHSYVIGVGGGALLDVVGLAAATAHRGVRHVRIPTTTLSQADSGVGVKNGINAFGKKNFIGTFAPPYAVINDFQLLTSLSPRDKRAGYIEAIKVALIRDKEFFQSIEREVVQLSAFEPAAMQRLIYRCAELHVNHIATAGDPFEFGSARPLDFGHWSAHKLEQLSEYKIRHGEAVAIGIALDTIYAHKIGLLDESSMNRVLQLIENLGFELFANELLHSDSEGSLLVLTGLEEFREHLGGDLTITLLKAIGQGVEVHEMSLPKVAEAIHELRSRASASARGHKVVRVRA